MYCIQDAQGDPVICGGGGASDSDGGGSAEAIGTITVEPPDGSFVALGRGAESGTLVMTVASARAINCTALTLIALPNGVPESNAALRMPLVSGAESAHAHDGAPPDGAAAEGASPEGKQRVRCGPCSHTEEACAGAGDGVATPGARDGADGADVEPRRR